MTDKMFNTKKYKCGYRTRNKVKYKETHWRLKTIPKLKKNWNYRIIKLKTTKKIWQLEGIGKTKQVLELKIGNR